MIIYAQLAGTLPQVEHFNKRERAETHTACVLLPHTQQGHKLLAPSCPQAYIHNGAF